MSYFGPTSSPAPARWRAVQASRAASGVTPGFSRPTMNSTPTFRIGFAGCRRHRHAITEDRRDRAPDLRALRIVERRRHHADDLVRLIVEPHVPADDGRIGAEPRAHSAVADHDDRRARRAVVVGPNRAPEVAARRRSPRRRCRTRRSLAASPASPSPSSTAVHVRRPDRRDATRRRACASPMSWMSRYDSSMTRMLSAALVPQPTTRLSGIADRHRLQQHRIHGAEDRGAGADRQRERRDRGERVTGSEPNCRAAKRRSRRNVMRAPF